MGQKYFLQKYMVPSYPLVITGRGLPVMQQYWQVGPFIARLVKTVNIHHVLAKTMLDETVGSICLESRTTGSPVGPETLQVLGLMYSLSMCKGCKL